MSARIQSQNPLSVFTLATRWCFISQLESRSVPCWLWSVWQSVWVVRLFFPRDSLTNKPSPGGMNASHRRGDTVVPGRTRDGTCCVISSFWSPSQKRFPPSCHLHPSLSFSKWFLKPRVKMICHKKSKWGRHWGAGAEMTAWDGATDAEEAQSQRVFLGTSSCQDRASWFSPGTSSVSLQRAREPADRMVFAAVAWLESSNRLSQQITFSNKPFYLQIKWWAVFGPE